MSFRGDMSDMRDMSVANLLRNVLERAEKQQGLMATVASMFTSIQRVFLTTNDRKLILEYVNRIMDEEMVLKATIVTSGDKSAMTFLIHKANKLSNQLLRPRPRTLRTKQVFNEFRQAWRYSSGLSMAALEEMIQANTISVIKDIPVVRGNSQSAKRSFVQRVKDAITSGSDNVDVGSTNPNVD